MQRPVGEKRSYTYSTITWIDRETRGISKSCMSLIPDCKISAPATADAVFSPSIRRLIQEQIYRASIFYVKVAFGTGRTDADVACRINGIGLRENGIIEETGERERS